MFLFLYICQKRYLFVFILNVYLCLWIFSLSWWLQRSCYTCSYRFTFIIDCKEWCNFTMFFQILARSSCSSFLSGTWQYVLEHLPSFEFPLFKLRQSFNFLFCVFINYRFFFLFLNRFFYLYLSFHYFFFPLPYNIIVEIAIGWVWYLHLAFTF